MLRYFFILTEQFTDLPYLLTRQGIILLVIYQSFFNFEIEKRRVMPVYFLHVRRNSLFFREKFLQIGTLKYFSDKLIGLSGSNAHICMLCSIINTKCLFCYLLILSSHKACNVFTDQCGNT